MPADDSPAPRAAFEAAVARFLTTVDAIGAEQWSEQVSDDWTVRQLVAHVVRGMSVISDYLDAGSPQTGVLLPDASTYFRVALDGEGVHAGIAGRAVAAADGAGDDMSSWARDVAGTAVARVRATGDDEVLVHFAGPLRFIDYLDTRTTELVLHTLDIQLACGLELDVPADALAIVNGVLLALTDRADPVALALALSGRSGPRGTNVLG